jgi:hypothetical protein
VISGPVGIRTEHFLASISKVMDMRDGNDMKGHYVVMDNAPIHIQVGELVNNRG